MYVNVPQENVHLVPDTVPRTCSLSPSVRRRQTESSNAFLCGTVDVAALAEPLAVAWHAVECSDLQEGDTALVCGAGPIGALIAR